MKESYDEYTFLTGKLDELNWALNGECNDIDCDKYLYKNLLKKKYKPVLKHSFSCLESLKREKSAVERLLSLPKYRKFRYKKCNVCKKKLDKLSDKSCIVSFTRPSTTNAGYFEIDCVWTHRSCEKRVKAPKGWRLGL